MAYRIQYGKSSQNEKYAIMRYSKKWKTIKLAVVGFVILAIGFLARIDALDFLIPGNKEVTVKAFRTMINEVQGGRKVKDAVTAFCDEILSSDQVKD